MNLEDSQAMSTIPHAGTTSSGLTRANLIVSLGQHLSKRRLTTRLSIKTLSLISDVPVALIASLESGTLPDLDIRTVARLCEALNISVCELFADAKLYDEHYRWYH